MAIANSSKVETCRSFFKAHKAKSSLSPKIKESKALISLDPRKIKRMVQNKPSIQFKRPPSEISPLQRSTLESI